MIDFQIPGSLSISILEAPVRKTEVAKGIIPLSNAVTQSVGINSSKVPILHGGKSVCEPSSMFNQRLQQ